MAKDISKVRSNINVITEQGDLGLGITPVTESEQKTVEKNDDKKEQ